MMYTLGADGLEEIKVEGFRIGQRVRWAHSYEFGYVVGQTDTGYTVILDDLQKINGQRGGALSPYGRITAVDEPDATPEMLEDLEARTTAKQAQDRIDQETAAKAHAEEVARITAELRAKYPNADNRYPGKNLKAELVKAFPGVKFSVRYSSFSGGDSLDITWTDGPTSEQVEEYSSKYQPGSFNGMEDIYENDNSAFSRAVSNVLGNAKYVSTNRKVSEGLRERIAADLIALGVDTQAHDYRRHDILNVEIYGEYQGVEVENGKYIAKFAKPERIEAPAETKGETITPCGVTIRENEEKNGIEVIFPSRPDNQTLDSLKANGFRWSKFQKLWYTKATDNARQFAQSL